jgi:hypothetical protein
MLRRIGMINAVGPEKIVEYQRFESQKICFVAIGDTPAQISNPM